MKTSSKPLFVTEAETAMKKPTFETKSLTH